MAFETEIMTLGTTPVDVHDSVDPDAGLTGAWRTVENTGTTALRYRETTAAPALTDKGHALGAGDVVVVLIVQAFWVWSPAASGEITVSAGAPSPVRDA